MTDSQLDVLFSTESADRVRSAVIGALGAGVTAADNSYEFGQPRTDGHTYGNDLWRFVWYEMAKQLGALPDASVCRPRGSFLVDLGKAVLYPFRYGAARSSDVTTHRLADSQFRRDLLVDPTTAPHLIWPQVVLVPYAANPTAGLLRAFVGGARIIDGDLLDWLWLEELELGGTAPTGNEITPAAPSSMPPFARSPEPTLDLALTDADPGKQGSAGG